MKKLILSAFFVFGVVFSVSAQGAMPAGSSDKNLDDRNIKDRSIEIEKAKREAEKPNKNKQSNDPTAQLKFAEIKEDFQ